MQGREANRRRQRRINQHHGLVPTPSPHATPAHPPTHPSSTNPVEEDPFAHPNIAHTPVSQGALGGGFVRERQPSRGPLTLFVTIAPGVYPRLALMALWIHAPSPKGCVRQPAGVCLPQARDDTGTECATRNTAAGLFPLPSAWVLENVWVLHCTSATPWNDPCGMALRSTAA